MSTDLITYSSALPDFLKDSGGYRDEGMTAGIAPKAPKLAVTTAKQWTITDNGQTQILPTPTVKGVIIASSGTLTKAWYEKAYVPGTNAAPDCFSNDGKVPAAGVAKPQCANCATCPKNAFGSHPVTGRGKACGDRKMIVVALDSMPDKLATFNVPTMSLSSLRDIDGKLKANNIPLQSVMMEFSFDPGVLYPVVKIGAVGFIGKEHFEKFRDAADSEEVSALLREVDYDPATETAQQPVVPNNQIAFGQTQANATEPQASVPDPKQVALDQAKAAYEAALAAAAGGTNETTTTHENQQSSNTKQQPAQTAGILDGGQADAGATANASNVAPIRRKRRTQAEMEAERVAKAASQQPAGQSGNSDLLTQGIASTLQAEQQQQEQAPVTTVASGGAPNVLDLLSKWANK